MALNLLSVTTLVLCISLLLLVLAFIIRLFFHFRLKNTQYSYLQLTPPQQVGKSLAATHKMFKALHAVGPQSVLARFLVPQANITLEIISSQTLGVRYGLRIDTNQIEFVRQTLHSYFPDVNLKLIEDPLDLKNIKKYKAARLKLKHHFGYPIHTEEELLDGDPVSYLINSMSKADEHELIVLQILTKPTVSYRAKRFQKKMMRNQDIHPYLVRGRQIRRVIGIPWRVISWPYKFIFQWIMPAASNSNFADGVMRATNMEIYSKLTDDLFKADIRFLVAGDSDLNIAKRMKNVIRATKVYKHTSQQGFTPKEIKLCTRNVFAERKTLWSFFASFLSAKELASIYHFPVPINERIEGIIASRSRVLPPSRGLALNKTKNNVTLGTNVYDNKKTEIVLSSKDRERHLYIVGGTGNGKTTMMQHMAVQDVRSGKGLAIIDPHGDFAESILSHVPESRIKDVVYFNPDDLEYPIGFNLLELREDLSGENLVREKDLITEATISVLRKLFSDDDSGGHRIEYILRNTIQTALTLEDATLFTIFRLINDNKFRATVVKDLDDKDLKEFWNNEFNAAGSFQKVKMSAGITSKIGRFLFSATVRRVVEQKRSTIDFESIMSEGKILICNFSKGLIGEDASMLFGTMTLARIQIAALRRARIHQDQRRPFYLYVDEFQNFATMSFVQMLSEARKYRLYLTLAEQSVSQLQNQRMADIILANVGTLVCFRSGSVSDERVFLPLFEPELQKGDITNLDAYNFYIRIASGKTSEPTSGQTMPLEAERTAKQTQTIINYSRKRYATEYDQSF